MDIDIIHPTLKKRVVSIGAISIIVPLLLLSSIEFNGYINNLSLVKYALAQQDSTNNNNVGNTQSNISNQSFSSSSPSQLRNCKQQQLLYLS